jgi:hypothetical protein
MTASKIVLNAASGVGGAGLDVDEVFSTHLYTGNGSTQTITNGIDLAGEGGMLWFKCRSSARDHAIYDTERPANGSGYRSRLSSNDTDAAQFFGNEFDDFTSSGFSLSGTGLVVNSSGATYASWAFRKAPKFFDVVTWTGTGSTQTIAHNLGSVPGMVMVKRTDASTIWPVYHTGVNGGTNPENYILYINGTAAQIDTNTYWNDTAPTDSVFTVGTNTNVNASGGTYVAYLFAHNDGDGEFGPDADQDIIKCGSFTTDGSGFGQDVNLGWKPQWLLVKRADSASGGDWKLIDTMRGYPAYQANNSATQSLEAEDAAAEAIQIYGGILSGTGFKIQDNASATYIYIAIRRGPLAPPESATDVFSVIETNSAFTTAMTTGFPVDAQLARATSQTSNSWLVDRLRGVRTGASISTRGLRTNSTDGTNLNNGYSLWWNSTGFAVPAEWSSINTVFYNWKRAPNFFDVVAFTGDGTTSRYVNHNLEVIPELVIIKRRSSTGQWWVDHDGAGAGKVIYFNRTNAAFSYTAFGTHTSTQIQLETAANNDTNASGSTYIAYLFASLAGISKVGSYTGNGTNQIIDCGFSAGARFVLCKRTDSTSNWLLFDSERGINAGNDPVTRLDIDNAPNPGNYDLIDPHSSGFIIVDGDASYSANINGASYIFYAIA